MTLLDSLIHMLQVDQTISGTQLIHLAIDARGNHLGFASKAKVLQKVDTLFSSLIVHHHSTTFKGIVNLGGMERERNQITLAHPAFAIHFHTKCMSCIVDDFQAIPIGNSLNLVHLAGFAITTHGHNGSGFWCNSSLYLFRINTTSFFLNIHKHRTTTVPPNAVSSSHKAIRCGDYFACDAQCLQSSKQW